MNKLWPFFLSWSHVGICTLYTLLMKYKNTESQAANKRILFL